MKAIDDNSVYEALGSVVAVLASAGTGFLFFAFAAFMDLPHLGSLIASLLISAGMPAMIFHFLGEVNASNE